MPIKFNLEKTPFPISQKLLLLLASELNNQAVKPVESDSLVFNFRDPSYSAEKGDFHPVEIRLIKNNQRWSFDYITDFCFVGSGYNAELTKEIDFDFTNNYGFHLYTGEFELRKLSELYQLWESNFISYVEMNVFTVSISTD